MRASTKKNLDDLLDVFGGADGGIQFARFRGLLAEIDRQAEQGDKASVQIIAIVQQFTKLVTLNTSGAKYDL